ncbi:hypothetical protein ACP70R_004970 [Stipagrostis hirtigluma subsp. patula]
MQNRMRLHLRKKREGTVDWMSTWYTSLLRAYVDPHHGTSRSMDPSLGLGIETLTLAAPAEGGGDASLAPAAVAARPGCSDGLAAVASAAGGTTWSGSASLGSATPSGTAAAATARRRTPGRWRRIPRAAPAPTQVPSPDLPLSELLTFRSPELRKHQCKLTPEETEERWRRSTFQIEPPKLLVFGSREYEETMVQVNGDLLEKAKQLEEADEELCDDEEAKVMFRAFKVKFSAIYRDHAAMTPENVVFNFK